MKKLKSFTLAEAVITLIFLSIIASNIIPAMMSTRPSTEKVLFKKAYSLTEQTINSIINDDILYPATTKSIKCNNLNEDCLKGFLETTTGSASGETDERATYYTYQALVKESKCKEGPKLVRLFCATLNTTQATCSDANRKCSFTTADGIKWTITQTYTDSELENSDASPKEDNDCSSCNDINCIKPLLKILVDVNGDKEPNTTTGVNIPDQYRLLVYYNGKVQVDKITSPKGITFLKNPINNKRRSDIEDDRFHED